MTQRARGFVMLPLACLCLSGCLGALLGGGKPAQLYHFGTNIPAPAAESAATAPMLPPALTAFHPVQFPQANWDRILATRGAQSFYIKDARWISPASDLFEQTVRNAFRLRARAITLGRPEDPLPASYALQITVERFEAAYTPQSTAPTIMIDVRVLLIGTKSHKLEKRLFLQEAQPATDNTVAAIVDAFDIAASRSAIKTADWANTAVLTQGTN